MSFIDCIGEMNNTKLDNAKDLDGMMQICNLIAYSNNYAKKSGGLWQYHKDFSNDNITDS